MVAQDKWFSMRASGDGDEMGVSFNRSPLLFETATENLLSNGYCDNNPL